MSRATVLAARQSFSDWGVWPRQRADVDPEGWLANFDEEDQDVAVELLDAFVFFNVELTEQLFLSACMSISPSLQVSSAARRQAWQAFRATALVTFPGEEDQNPTDSGHRFATIARDKLGFEPVNIHRPADATRVLAGAHSPRPLVVVDDILGSGTQFLDTWNERLAASESATTSLGEEVRRLELKECFLLVALATQTGIEELKEHAPDVTVYAANVLPRESSLNHPSTHLLPTSLIPRVASFVEKYSRKAGISSDIWGYRNMALAVGFEHGVPDLTLPLFWHASDSWVPLRRRR